MTQQQIISQLNSIMPEIAETKDPKGVMLKCARAHNLSPAQLEKLGHVFNTAKTLVGLESQENRGDSFTIVDVPEMVSEYTTWDPAKGVDHSVNRSVNQVLKYASSSKDQYWGKKARALTEKLQMQKSATVDINAILKRAWSLNPGTEFHDKDSGQQDMVGELTYATPPDIVHEKAASVSAEIPAEVARMDVADQLQWAHDTRNAAIRDLNQVKYEMACDVREKVASLVEKIRKEELPWSEIAGDIHDTYDQEKAASLVEMIENYMAGDGHMKVAHVDLASRTKRAFARDAHNILPVVDDILEAEATWQKAAAALKSIEEDDTVQKQAAGSVSPLLKDMSTPMMEVMADPTTIGKLMDLEGKTKRVEEGKSLAARQAVMQHLMLSDPVIQQADPATVEDLYNTIQSISPTVASDPVMVGPVLKEGLQYGAVPIQMIKDLVEVERGKQLINSMTSENAKSVKH